MSKHSLRYTFSEEKFNLKTIVYLFILLDLFLFFEIPFSLFLMVVGLEGSIIMGLMLGLRGQNKFRRSLVELGVIARNKKLSDLERGHRLEQQVYHTLLEYGIWFDEQLYTYGIDHFKKKRENSEEVKDG